MRGTFSFFFGGQGGDAEGLWRLLRRDLRSQREVSFWSWEYSRDFYLVECQA